MNESTNFRRLSLPTRRQLLSGTGLVMGGLLAGSRGLAESPPEPMRQAPATAGNRQRTSLHDEVMLTASAARIYATLLDGKQFAACTGLPAEIDPKAGGGFSMFGGQIVGRNVELVADRLVVQAWRPTHWDPGVYSMAKFELKPMGSGTMIVLDHTGFPAGEYDSLESGWTAHYWNPLKKFLV